jgi:hypothetical protein
MRILIGVLFIFAFVGSTLGQTPTNDLAKLQSEIASINVQISNERAKASRSRVQLTMLGNEYNPIKARHDALQRKYASDAAAYNGNCAGRPVNYGNCPSWRARMLAEQRQLGSIIFSLERRAHELDRQGQQVSNELVLANARIQKLTNYRSQLEARVRTLKANLVPAVPAASPAQTATTRPCEGTFCIQANPKNPDIGTAATSKKLTTYPSASAQAKAMGKDPEHAGCIFDGRGGCKSATSMSFPNGTGGRGTASLSPAVKEAMSKTPEGQKLIKEEAALRVQLAKAEAAATEIKVKRDSETDPAKRGELGVEYAKADKIRSDIGQNLYVKEIQVESEAKKYVLDK